MRAQGAGAQHGQERGRPAKARGARQGAREARGRGHAGHAAEGTRGARQERQACGREGARSATTLLGGPATTRPHARGLCAQARPAGLVLVLVHLGWFSTWFFDSVFPESLNEPCSL